MNSKSSYKYKSWRMASDNLCCRISISDRVWDSREAMDFLNDGEDAALMEELSSLLDDAVYNEQQWLGTPFVNSLPDGAPPPHHLHSPHSIHPLPSSRATVDYVPLPHCGAPQCKHDHITSPSINHRPGINKVAGKRDGGIRKRDRVALVVESTEGRLFDGYKWRKYGQKPIKNKPYPRMYFRCANTACSVKKRIDRDGEIPHLMVVTYEGHHNHHSHELVNGAEHAWLVLPSFLPQHGTIGKSCTTLDYTAK